MPEITYVQFDGSRRTVSVPIGQTLLQAAMRFDIDGLDGECGGSCSCGTCHCHVDETFLAVMPTIDANEDFMLDNAATARRPDSRLACQITVTAEMEGLVVRLPER
jgi:2Fe-2S ferredoxin